MSTHRVPRDFHPSVALRVAAGLPVPDDVAARLNAGGRALELDCGGGLGCLALAEAFPAAAVTGHERDARAVARARALARASGLAERVTFVQAGATRLGRAAFDLVTVNGASARADALELLNDLRNALRPEGVCLLVEPAAPPVGGSVLVPAARDERARALRALAWQAGFQRFEVRQREASLEVYELRR